MQDIHHSPQAREGASNHTPALAALACGSDFLTVSELALWAKCKPQTIRKNVSQHGHFHGLRPVRRGRRVMFRVSDVATSAEGAQ